MCTPRWAGRRRARRASASTGSTSWRNGRSTATVLRAPRGGSARRSRRKRVSARPGRPERPDQPRDGHEPDGSLVRPQRLPDPGAGVAAVLEERRGRTPRRDGQPGQLPRRERVRQHGPRPVPELGPHRHDGDAAAQLRLRVECPVAAAARVVRDARPIGGKQHRGNRALDGLHLEDVVGDLRDRLRAGRLPRARPRGLPAPAVPRGERRRDAGGTLPEPPAAARPEVAVRLVRAVRGRRPGRVSPAPRHRSGPVS